ncbi:hypothetical protein D9M70_536420 [compost metagenome]
MLAQRIVYLLGSQPFAPQVAPALDAAQHRQVPQQVQQAGRVATFAVTFQALRQPAGEMGGALGQPPDPLAVG